MKKIRTRFAPSPTGYMHIGNLRTALYEFLVAKKNNGDFILRIEDTDQERFVEGALDIIYNTLKIARLAYDEGPDKEGPFGPYIQSQRKAIYRKHAELLVEKGGGYYCFCTKKRLDALKQECELNKTSYKYDGKCKNLSLKEIETKISQGEPFVIRQNIRQNEVIAFHDEILGDISIESNSLDEGIMLKSDGLPTYNFANVIDDHLMEITHVIRGNEYISSTPKHVLLYRAFGWDLPVFVHLPPIMKSATKKLSKREGDASFEDFFHKGFLCEAIINYIALLGWSPGNNKEFFTLPELINEFTIEGLSKSPAIFDINKLKWMNSEYIRKLSLDDFYQLAFPYLKDCIKIDNFDFKRLCELIQMRIETLEDIKGKVLFLSDFTNYSIDLFNNKKMKTDLDLSVKILNELLTVIYNIEQWIEDVIKEKIMAYITQSGLKNGQVFWVLRIAISGLESTPGGAVEICYLLHKDEIISRIKKSLNLIKTGKLV